ncbi:uncharacterized protein BO80DRAFT_421747 [Aspergillus ibericus CBS 121593]|uniref:Uncharacterized protein n=1 Tax=Aspergillus ibericus CBS 121593 TaxID=1448316 RepID=A0A395HC98_9EURO|nr:hypothetical protein BO80DRAFT_421747 [Aspergillus ibericus CBS 121593]RAL05109.1 hypothetical protein BO80DRAFT_421747 [Aspergillus ibericus CBS 121593]
MLSSRRWTRVLEFPLLDSIPQLWIYLSGWSLVSAWGGLIVRRKQPQLDFSTATTERLSDYPCILICPRRHRSFSTAHLFSERFLVSNRLHDTLITAT